MPLLRVFFIDTCGLILSNPQYGKRILSKVLASIYPLESIT